MCRCNAKRLITLLATFFFFGHEKNINKVLNSPFIPSSNSRYQLLDYWVSINEVIMMNLLRLLQMQVDKFIRIDNLFNLLKKKKKNHICKFIINCVTLSSSNQILTKDSFAGKIVDLSNADVAVNQYHLFNVSILILVCSE